MFGWKFNLLIIAVMLWRLIRVCTFDVAVVLALAFAWYMEYSLPWYAYATLIAVSVLPVIYATWDAKSREMVYALVNCKALRVTDISLSVFMAMVLTAVLGATGPWWASVAMFIESMHHVILLYYVAQNAKSGPSCKA